MERLFTVSEVARRIKVTERTIRAWISKGRLRAYKVGSLRLWRIKKSDLESFLKEP